MSLFSIRLRNLRKKYGERQETLAETLGISRSTLSGYERGVIVPPYEKISKIAQRYNVSVNYLMGQSDMENELDRKKVADTEPMDIGVQIQLMCDALANPFSAIRCNGVVMNADEKSRILPYIRNCCQKLNAIGNEREGD